MDIAAERDWPLARLDADYTARLTCSDAEFRRIIAEYATMAQAALDLPDVRRDIAYDGANSAETYDLFGPAAGGARPCFVFVHGGYWKALGKQHSAGMAPMLAAHGIACAVPDYTLAPQAPLAEIVRQCRAMLAHLWHHADALGIDRTRIVVGGSSAGGHLTAAMAAGGWQAAAGLPDQPLLGQMPVSGLFELAPLAACHVSEWMRFTAEEIEQCSPLRHLPAGPLPAVVALAAVETPGFQRQSAAYAAAVGTTPLTIAGRNHFDVLLDLMDDRTELAQALLGLF